MLSVEEALTRVLEAVRPVIVVDVPLQAALGRVLARDLYSGVPLPHWDNSAMDGYAVCSADFSASEAGSDCDAPRAEGEGRGFEVLETIAAGRVGTVPVRPGFTSRIMTGAPMPEGADAVIIREQSAPLSPGPDGRERVLLKGGAKAGQHVRRAGGELSIGARILSAGTTLSPAAIGLCGSIGLSAVPVARRPRVGIVSTGDEIVEPGAPLGPGQIWSSNTLTLIGLVLEAGALPVDCGVAPDTLEGTHAAFQRALGCDFILSTGGVSVGDFDLVKQVFAEEGADMRFWRVRLKPGKPLAFGFLAGRPLFGLPGNPVSTFVNFLQFVRPVLRRSMGDPRPYLPVVDAFIEGDVRRHTGREELIRVSLRWSEGRLLARPTTHQGSSELSGVSAGHGFALIATDRAQLFDGDPVAVQIFDPGFGASDVPDYRW